MQKVAKSMMEGLSGATRDTDVKGWHDEGLAIGIIFSEMTGKEAVPSFTPRDIAGKCSRCLASCLGAERFSRVKISWQVFPEEFPKQTANLVLIQR